MLTMMQQPVSQDLSEGSLTPGKQGAVALRPGALVLAYPKP